MARTYCRRPHLVGGRRSRAGEGFILPPPSLAAALECVRLAAAFTPSGAGDRVRQKCRSVGCATTSTRYNHRHDLDRRRLLGFTHGTTLHAATPPGRARAPSRLTAHQQKVRKQPLRPGPWHRHAARHGHLGLPATPDRSPGPQGPKRHNADRSRTRVCSPPSSFRPSSP
jgi:hypothetical protein